MKRKETIRYVKDLVESENAKINDYLGQISLSQQEQIDEILLNHVSVPGLINTALLPAEGDGETSNSPKKEEAKANTSGGNLVGGAIDQLKGQVEKTVTSIATFALPGAPKRQKMLIKFKGRKGPYNTLPEWILNFEREIRVELENMRSGLNNTKTTIKEENQKSLDGQVSQMTEKLNEEMSGAKTVFEESLTKVAQKVNERM